MILRYLVAEAKPGHEFEYRLAWKHHTIAGWWMHRLRFFAFWPWSKKYDQALRLWLNSLRRLRKHGCDVITK